jgi:hypothetical protein
LPTMPYIVPSHSGWRGSLIEAFREPASIAAFRWPRDDGGLAGRLCPSACAGKPPTTPASPGAVGQVPALRDDAFESKLACVREDRRAIAGEMLGELNPVAAREQLFELPLALFEWYRPNVLAVQLDQVEGKEEHGRVVRAGMQLIEIRFAEPCERM